MCLYFLATWTGGIFVHGTAEAIFSKSLAWCQMPLGYSLSLFFGNRIIDFRFTVYNII